VFARRPVDGSPIVRFAQHEPDTKALLQADHRVMNRWRPLAVDMQYGANAIDRPRAERKDLSLTDFPSEATDCLVASTRARDAILERFESVTEFLPLVCADQELWAMHVLPCVEAIDVARSCPRLEGFDFVAMRPVGPKLGIKEPVAFRDEVIRSLPVFRDRSLKHRWFMTQIFVDHIRNKDLLGFDARVIYDSHRHKSGFDENGDPR
jgi:hypothetical protein